jgi:hypothetical protein
MHLARDPEGQEGAEVAEAGVDAILDKLADDGAGHRRRQ